VERLLSKALANEESYATVRKIKNQTPTFCPWSQEDGHSSEHRQILLRKGQAHMSPPGQFLGSKAIQAWREDALCSDTLATHLGKKSWQWVKSFRDGREKGTVCVENMRR
jgi:hypothetical protein